MQLATLRAIPFHLGLDLSGGSHLLYKADVSNVPSGEIDDSMDALRDVIERRINLFGVAEPTVQGANGNAWRDQGTSSLDRASGDHRYYQSDHDDRTDAVS